MIPVTQLSFGLSRIPRANAHKDYDDDSVDILAEALESGINFFDVSPNYPQSHASCVRLKLRKKGVRPFFVASKVGLLGSGQRNFSIHSLNQQLNLICHELNVKTVDILQINKPSLKDMEENELLGWIHSLKKKGKVKYAGIIIGDPSVLNFIVKSEDIDCIQVKFNLIDFKFLETMKKAYTNGITVLANSPLNSGLLSGYYSFEKKNDGNDCRRFFTSNQEIRHKLSIVKKVQKELSISNDKLLAFSLMFVISNPHVSSTLFSASSVMQVKKIKEIASQHEIMSLSELNNIMDVVSTILDHQ